MLFSLFICEHVQSPFFHLLFNLCSFFFFLSLLSCHLSIETMATPAPTPGSIGALLSSYDFHCRGLRAHDSFKHVDGCILQGCFPSPLILRVRSVKWQGTHGSIRLFRIVLSDGENLLCSHPSTVKTLRSKLYRQIQHSGTASLSAGKLLVIKSFDMCRLRDPGLSTFSPSLILKTVTVLK
jgi:hypothetical protein